MNTQLTAIFSVLWNQMQTAGRLLKGKTLSEKYLKLNLSCRSGEESVQFLYQDVGFFRTGCWRGQCINVFCVFRQKRSEPRWSLKANWITRAATSWAAAQIRRETRDIFLSEVSSSCGHAVSENRWCLKSVAVLKNHFDITETQKKKKRPHSLGDAFMEPLLLENLWERFLWFSEQVKNFSQLWLTKLMFLWIFTISWGCGGSGDAK